MKAKAKALKQAMIALWFEDQNPLTDEPRETSDIMQPTVDATVVFAEAIIRRHYDGVCDCQHERIPTEPAAEPGFK